MARATVSDEILGRLVEWGVTRVFGYPGDGINGLVGAFADREGALEFIQARHEETAALMAVAAAKFGDDVGVCMATSGPGAVHLLNGLYDARKDHVPVVAIVGQQPRSALGADQHQELDLQSLLTVVAPECTQTISVPEQVHMAIDRAMRIARARRTVTCVIVPNDVQELEGVGEPPRAHGMQRTSAAYSEPIVVPRDADLDAAIEVLTSGQRLAILIGAGASAAAEQVERLADRLDAWIAKALLGKDVLPDAHPRVTGAIGLLGTKPSWELMQQCDTLLLVGTSFPYTEFLPESDAVRAVQIDLDPTRVGQRFPTECNLVGDAAATLDALLERLPAQLERDHDWSHDMRDHVSDWLAELERAADAQATPINPQRVARELSRHLPDHAIVTADSGTSVSWYARHVELRTGMRGSVSGQLASMGVGVPYALGAKEANPDRPVVALLGDGSMQMNGLAELLTVRHRCARWADPRLVVAVLDNRDLNMVTWEQRAMAGDPRFAPSQDLPPTDYAAVARAMGLRAIRVDHPDAVADAWAEAFSASEPVLLDFVVDPDVPPLPPHISIEQAKHFLFSMLRGDSERGGVLAETLRGALHRA
jgi:pyruvate dehydrogenase (quinone)